MATGLVGHTGHTHTPTCQLTASTTHSPQARWLAERLSDPALTDRGKFAALRHAEYSMMTAPRQHGQGMQEAEEVANTLAPMLRRHERDEGTQRTFHIPLEG